MKAYFPASQFGLVQSFSPIALGMSGARVYAVSTEAGEFILRLSRDGVDPSPMIAAQKAAATHGIAPRIVRVDAQAVISVRIEGMPLGQALGHQDARGAVLASLMDQLNRLHAAPVTGLKKTDVIAQGLELWAAQSARSGFPAWGLPLFERLQHAESELAGDDRLVFSHCDLNPGNILWDGSKVWLVDWEQACAAHPYVDAATIGVFLGLADEDALGLLAMQEKTVISPGQRRRFLAMRDLVRMIYACVFCQLIPDLAAVPFRALEDTPSLQECFGRVAGGTLDMSQAEGRGLMAAALLKPCCVS